jgi:hypothetical protein
MVRGRATRPACSLDAPGGRASRNLVWPVVAAASLTDGWANWVIRDQVSPFAAAVIASMNALSTIALLLGFWERLRHRGDHD